MGAPLDDPVICPNCGEPEGTTPCAICGTRSAASPLETIRAAARAVKPPRFDRIVVRNWRIFGRFPRNDHAPSPLLGFPVYLDEKVEPGTIELRMGDEVIERVRI